MHSGEDERRVVVHVPSTCGSLHKQYVGICRWLPHNPPALTRTHYSPIIGKPETTGPLRVLVAPDKYAGTLSAAEAAAAIAAGWHRARPKDAVSLLPLADGGPGFLAAIAAARGGQTIHRRVSAPLPGDRVAAEVLLVASDDLVGDFHPTAYIESAQACGLDLIEPADRDPRFTTSAGVGELILAAVQEGVGSIVVGLGGSGTNDGGAGMLAALGATAVNAQGEDVTNQLRAGGAALETIESVDLTVPRSLVAPIQLVAASDVDVQLLGKGGASLGFSKQKGAKEHHSLQLERALRSWSKAAGEALATSHATGAAGGLGYGLALLGAEYRSGSQTVLDAVRFEDRCSVADLVITGEGRVDWQSLRGKLVGAVVDLTNACGATSLVLAGDSELESDSDTGLQPPQLDATRLHTVVGKSLSPTEAMAEPSAHLSDLAERVAGAW